MKNMMPEYVDELKPYDIDMLEHNLDKNAKDHIVKTIYDIGRITHELIFGTLKKIGVPVSEFSSGESIDALLKKHGVKVECRRYSGDDEWRSGTYIYKGMDLVGFVSIPLFKKPSMFEINRTPQTVIRVALQ